MSEKDLPAVAWAPEACTLPTAERPLRLAEFDALFTAASRSVERVAPQHLRVLLVGDADAVRDLAARETECCSFFRFSVGTGEDGQVRLDVEVPAAHVDVLDAMEQRAATVRGGR